MGTQCLRQTLLIRVVLANQGDLSIKSMRLEISRGAVRCHRKEKRELITVLSSLFTGST